jgi:hypothetical protein
VELCPLAFERWQFNCMLQRQLTGTALLLHPPGRSGYGSVLDVG